MLPVSFARVALSYNMSLLIPAMFSVASSSFSVAMESGTQVVILCSCQRDEDLSKTSIQRILKTCGSILCGCCLALLLLTAVIGIFLAKIIIFVLGQQQALLDFHYKPTGCVA